MTRPRKSRVQPKATEVRASKAAETKPPSMRQRKPFMYWSVVVAVAAMIIVTFGSFLSLLAQ